MSAEIIHGDCLEVMRGMADASVDAVVTDPPYFRVKGEAWDRQWDSADGFLSWLELVAVEWRRVLAPNGSLYVFTSPAMNTRVEVMLRRHFDVLSNIRWVKDAGWHNRTEKAALRSYLSPWEGIVFAGQHGGDTLAADTSGYYTATTALHRRIYAPVGDYFRKAREAAGLTRGEAEVALGYVSTADPSKGTALYTRWEEGSALPTPAAYARLQGLVGAANAPRPYGELRAWFDGPLRSEYESLRRPFALTDTGEWSDTWRFTPVAAYPGKHPCEKPLSLLTHILRTSTRPDALVLDCFAGSGAIGEACLSEGRRFIGIEKSQA